MFVVAQNNDDMLLAALDDKQIIELRKIQIV